MQTPSLASSIGVLPTRGVPRPKVAFLAVVALAASLAAISPSLHSTPAVSGPGVQERAAEGYGNLPISFEPNVGQAPGRYDFVARGQGFGMSISATGATLALGTGKVQGLVRLNLLGASPSVNPRALESLPGKVNYFIGNDPSKWRSEVPTFGSVSYRDVLPGIDVTYHGTNAGTLEYDFVVAPDADPGDIRVGFSGVNDVALRGGNLVITKAGGTVTQEAPVLYQTIAGRRVPVNGRFSLSGDQVGFEVGAYDHHHPLVIDPTLTYSTYLGGSGDDIGYGIAVDGTGAAYVTGYTTSTNFPTQAPFQASNAGGGGEAFVTKLNATGQALIYSTYLGGSNDDIAQGIAVDGTGAAYVTGSTSSTGFPTQLPFQGSNAGSKDAFVTKLNATGQTLTYSTYLGGSSIDSARGIAVDGSKRAYVTGYTSSTGFPTQSPFQASKAGSDDAFVTKFNAAGSALIYSTYVGGSGGDFAQGIAVDGTGEAYVTGYTNSTNFPTQSPLQASNAGLDDAFVTKFNAAGSALIYSTYLGGSGHDVGWPIGIDGMGAAYVTGYTLSANFPTQSPFQAAYAGSYDAFVTKLSDTPPVTCGGQTVTIQVTTAGLTTSGTAGNDVINGTPGTDIIYGLGGTDIICGLGGTDKLYGDAGTDKLYGGAGNDALLGGAGNDTIKGGAGKDELLGGAGNDTIHAAVGNDILFGAVGNDILFGDAGNDRLLGGAGGDILYGNDGNDSLNGGANTDACNGGLGTDNGTLCETSINIP